jgi:CubicO group peptidase (beta-lactamase class C family)
VVDLWGGFADEARTRPWTKDTISIVFSCTKGATALCAHILKSRSQIDYDAPVSRYWPDYAQAGKDATTVRMMLDHSAGAAALRETVRKDGVNDWDYMVGLLEKQEPFWQPGTRNGYHGLTFGWTVGEIVRRVSGQSLGTFFQNEVAKPLGIDFWIGLPEDEEHRVAPMIRYVWPSDVALPKFLQAVVKDKNSIPALFLLNSGGFMASGANSRAGHAAEIGAANGISNARGLAGMYQPLANGGGELVDQDTLAEMGRVAMATHFDATLCIPTRFALGFMKSMDNRKRSDGAAIMPGIDSVILSDAAFGHVGAGGSIGFADPECGLSFGYSMNRMGAGILLNPRGQALVDAAYKCLGYRDNDSGVWRQ